MADLRRAVAGFGARPVGGRCPSRFWVAHRPGNWRVDANLACDVRTPMRSEMTTVFIADDHPMYRDGVARTVRECEGLQLVGQAGDGHEALAEIRRLAPDVAVVDLDMPGCDGLALLRALASDGSATRVVILSATAGAEAIYDSISAGAAGYLSKDITRSEICSAIVAVGSGEIVFGRDARTGLASAIRGRAQEPSVRLTEREQEILRYVAEGLSAPKIGEELHLSAATVKTHLGTLYQKLGVSDRAAAVAVAMRIGLLS
jgi:two-component system nitrate/nitrite response regulator NarL